jgi:D-alanine-D-alanine ligase
MLRVGVLRGGADERYKTSIDNGANILGCLRGEVLSQKYKAVDIFIDENGVWHINGIPVTMAVVKEKVDLVINALLGKYAENGKIQKILEEYDITYTSSDSKSSFVCHNKLLTKEELKKLGIKTPKYIHFKSYKKEESDKKTYVEIKARNVWEKMSPPWIIKPVTNGSSVGVVLCKTFNELVEAIGNIADVEDEILVEEYIQGKEATVGIINNFRKQEFYALPPIEIKLNPGEGIFSYKQKSENLAKIICPGTFLLEEKQKMEKTAILIHKTFGLKYYSKIDFIVHPQKGIYVLEVNTQSEFMEKSQIPIALKAVGSNLEEFIDHLIKEAIK